MNARIRIAVADDEPDMRRYFEKILPRLGYECVAAAHNGRELVTQCRTHHPDLVITDIRMPVMDGVEAVEELYKLTPIPVVLVSAYHDSELIRRAEADHIVTCLLKPIKQSDLGPVISVAMMRFQQFQVLQRESEDLSHALEDRKIVERAKRMLGKHNQLDERDAFSHLQELATERNQKIVEIAQLILERRI